jgi:hypothetical protein
MGVNETFLGGAQQFGRSNLMAMLRKWVGSSGGVLVNAGAPTDGTSGTFADGAIATGTLLVDTTNGNLYVNQSTAASPVWALVGSVGSTVSGLGGLGVARATYDFSSDGGAIGAIGLGVTLPDNAVVIGGFVDVITTATSATDAGTGAISVQSADDIVAAIAISDGSNPWDAGLQAIVPKSNTPESTGIKLTADREITFTIAVEAFTAGKFEVFLHYVQSS